MDKKRLRFELHQLPRDEVRRGWARIHESQRGGIRAGELIEIEGPSARELRVVYGLPPNYLVGGSPAGENWICMDDPTREALGLTGVTPGSQISVSVRGFRWPLLPFKWISYALRHPEIALRVSSWLTLVLGLLSVILGFLSLLK